MRGWILVVRVKSIKTCFKSIGKLTLSSMLHNLWSLVDHKELQRRLIQHVGRNDKHGVKQPW